MSLTNPNTVVTEQRLSDFYKGILPYLGGSADAGFTPVGSVIAIMGVTAPANYLACDGTVYNIADYPELANYFYQQFGSKNKFGGNGTTTFAVPDLSGEFLRGTGTNSHENQGSGASVGVHQDGTQIAKSWSSDTIYVSKKVANKNDMDTNETVAVKYINVGSTTEAPNVGVAGITRPTNTSVLFCIATKNIYLNPSLDYSTDEKIVGTWIDGKPVYQKTITFSNITFNSANQYYYSLTGLEIDKAWVVNGFHYGGDYVQRPLDVLGQYKVTTWGIQNSSSPVPNSFYLQSSDGTAINRTFYITIQYTKTT